MARRVEWTRPARTDVEKLSKRDANRVGAAVRRLANSGQPDLNRLRGVRPPTQRLRIGSWRVITELEEVVVLIIRVFHRREAYRRSYWARQEVPEQGDAGESVGAETSGEVGKLHRTLSTGEPTGFRRVFTRPSSDTYFTGMDALLVHRPPETPAYPVDS